MAGTALVGGSGIGIGAVVDRPGGNPGPALRTWLSGYDGANGASARAAWASDYGFYPQVRMFYNDWESSWDSRTANIAGDEAQAALAHDGSKLNVLTVGLLLTASSGSDAEAPNPTALAAAAGGADRAAWQGIGHALRAGGLNTRDTVIRLGHEMNGNWYPWATGGDATRARHYREAWAVAVRAVRASCPLIRFDLCFNAGDGGRESLKLHYPGDDYVDIVSLDYYDFGEAGTVEAFVANQHGLGFSQVAGFAHAHGKRTALPEWGVNGNDANVDNRDNPFYVDQIYAALTGLNATYPGIVLYDSYFDQRNDFGFGSNPKAAAAYRRLWPTNGVTA